VVGARQAHPRRVELRMQLSGKAVEAGEVRGDGVRFGLPLVDVDSEQIRHITGRQAEAAEIEGVRGREVSDRRVAPMNTPSAQLYASVTSGTTEARRPPNKIASIFTPAGSSHSSAMDGHCDAGAVNRAFGCEERAPDAGVQSLPFQSMACAGGESVKPSHQTSPSSVSATLVKMQLALRVAMAFGFVVGPVPGATPKKPFSGLMARPS
jgi:hypothetical protein